MDIPIELTEEGHYRPRLGEARFIRFQLVRSKEGPGLSVVTCGERQHVVCRGWAGPPVIDGARPEPAPRELQDALFEWTRARLADAGLDPLGLPAVAP